MRALPKKKQDATIKVDQDVDMLPWYSSDVGHRKRNYDLLYGVLRSAKDHSESIIASITVAYEKPGHRLSFRDGA